MALFQRIVQGGKDSVVIFLGDGTIKPITDEHPRFEEIIQALADKASDDKLITLLDPASNIFAKTQKVSDRFTLAGGTLLFDGDPIDGPLADFIVNIAERSDTPKSYEAWVNFAEKLATNPSAESRDHLFIFMSAHGITVTPEGDIVLYKGVRSDGKSIHAGPGIVNGQEMNGNLPNEVGSVLEFPRSRVDANRGVACSTGLHAGTFEYASDFSQGRLLTVTINPRDVVSVPSDSHNQKVRVSRYTVAEVNEHAAAYNTPVWGDVSDEDEDNDWIDDDGDEYDPLDEYDDEFDDFPDEDEDEPEDEDEDETPEVVQTVPTPEFEAAVQDALVRIPAVLKGGWTKSLSLYASKHITAARREAWREAIRRTGLR